MKIKPKKSLGQNFLIDEEALTDIARAMILSGRHVIEVGPGYGALTEYIIGHHPASLDMVELDRDMVEILDTRFMAEDRLPDMNEDLHSLVRTTPIALHHTDVLHFTPPYDDYVVIANIPYYITSPILFHFLYPSLRYTEDCADSGTTSMKNTETGNQSVYRAPSTVFSSPEEMVIMMQEEVGEKILAGRNKKPHHSYLSLAMELACQDIEIVRYVGRESFDPAPKIDSIVLKFTVKRERDREQEKSLLKLWRYAFTHPRKTLMSNIRGSQYNIDIVRSWILECGYDEKVRAEAVGLEEWKILFDK